MPISVVLHDRKQQEHHFIIVREIIFIEQEKLHCFNAFVFFQARKTK